MEVGKAGPHSIVTAIDVETPIYTEYKVVFFQQFPPKVWSPHALEQYRKYGRNSCGAGTDTKDPDDKPRRFEGDESVAEMMAQGWRPHGGVSVREAPASNRYSSGETWLYQAMVR